MHLDCRRLDEGLERRTILSLRPARRSPRGRVGLLARPRGRGYRSTITQTPIKVVAITPSAITSVAIIGRS